MSIPDLLGEYIPSEVLNSHLTIFFGGDAPYSYDKVCAGVFFIKNTPKAHNLLKFWWNKDSPGTNMAHPDEQQALYDDLYNNHSISQMQDAIYMSPVLQFFEKRKKIPIRHIWSAAQEVSLLRLVNVSKSVSNNSLILSPYFLRSAMSTFHKR